MMQAEEEPLLSPTERSRKPPVEEYDDDDDEGMSCAMPTGADVSYFFTSKFPPAVWLPKYAWGEDFSKDVIAGLTVGVMAVPQAMSYATVAGLPPVYGLYNAFVGLLPYPFFGTSPHLISGPTAVMSILVGGVLPTTFDGVSIPGCHTPTPSEEAMNGWTSEDDTCGERIKLALLVAFIAGIIQIFMGCFKLGVLVDLISEPVIAGFTSGAAFLIAATQFSNILGIPKCHLYDDKTDSYSLPGCHFHEQVAWIFKAQMGDVHSYKHHSTQASCEGGYYCTSSIDTLMVNHTDKARYCEHEVNNVSRTVGAHSCNPPAYFHIKWQTLLFGLGCFCQLYFFQTVVRQRWKLKLLGNLGPLCCLLLAVPIVYYASPAHKTHNPKDITSHLNIRSIGEICKSDNAIDIGCLPSPLWPLGGGEIGVDHFAPSFSDMISLIGPAIAVALIGYMESMTIAKTVLKMRAKAASDPSIPMGSFCIKLDPSQELIALGSCNIAVSCLRGYPVTGSFSRTAVNGDSGARSPFACLTCSIVVGGALVFLAKFLQYLPKVVLAAIVLISIVKLVDYHEAIFLWHTSKRDFLVFATIFLSTVFLGVEIALLVGILGNWLVYLSANQRVPAVIMGTDASGTLIDVMGANASELMHSHVVVLRHMGDLAFCSAQYFKDMVEEGLEAAADVKVVVIDCSSMNTIDASGIHALRTIANQLSDNKIRLAMADVSTQAKRMLKLAAKYDVELQSGTHRWDTAMYEDGRDAPAANPNPPALMMFKRVQGAVAYAQQVTNAVLDPTKSSAADTQKRVGASKIIKSRGGAANWNLLKNTLAATRGGHSRSLQ